MKMNFQRLIWLGAAFGATAAALIATGVVIAYRLTAGGC